MHQTQTDKRQEAGRAFYPIYGFLTMLCCCGFSPIIRFYGTDSSVFYCLGRAMIRGSVVYRDVFDHKGIWIYFINSAGAFLDRFFPGWGMLIIEAVFACMLLYTADRIIGLFIRDEIPRRIAVCLFYGLTLNYFTYGGGNLTETYALVFQLAGCCLAMKYYCADALDHPPAYMFVHGICSGICLLLRANLTAIWVPFGSILAIRLLRNRRIRCFFMNLVFLVLGIGAAFALPVLYCLANHCLREMIFSAFIFNFSYVSAGGSLAALAGKLFMSGASAVLYLSLAGMFFLCRDRSLPAEAKLTGIFSLLMVLLLTFMGRRAYGHYFQTLLPFTLPVFIRIGAFFQGKRGRSDAGHANTPAVFLLCILLTLAGNLRLAIKYLPIDTEYRHLYAVLEQTGDYIGDSPEDDVLLSTANLMQAYVVTGTMPPIRYPYIPGVSYGMFPEPTDRMFEEIISGRYRYIFGSGYHNGYWNIFPYAQQYEDALNAYVPENYRVVFADERYGYVLFERDPSSGSDASRF